MIILFRSAATWSTPRSARSAAHASAPASTRRMLAVVSSFARRFSRRAARSRSRSAVDGSRTRPRRSRWSMMRVASASTSSCRAWARSRPAPASRSSWASANASAFGVRSRFRRRVAAYYWRRCWSCTGAGSTRIAWSWSWARSGSGRSTRRCCSWARSWIAFAFAPSTWPFFCCAFLFGSYLRGRSWARSRCWPRFRFRFRVRSARSRYGSRRGWARTRSRHAFAFAFTFTSTSAFFASPFLALIPIASFSFSILFAWLLGLRWGGGWGSYRGCFL